MIKPVFETLENRVLLSGAPSPIADAVEIKWRGNLVKVIQNEYLVHTRNERDFTVIADRFNLPVTDIKVIGDGFYKFSSAAKPRKIADWTRTYKKYIDAVSPNSIITAQATRPDDTQYGSQWWHSNVGLPSADIESESAWDIVNGDPETDPMKQMVVAVIDSGIYLQHPDLAGNIFVNPLEIPGNNIDDDANGYIDDVTGWNTVHNNNDPSDDDGHGTHVSGIIGAVGNNGEGVSGVLWRVKILPVKVLAVDGGSVETVINGMRYVSRLKEQGINIVAANASLGFEIFPFDELMSRAVQQMGERDIMFVTAAGNRGVNIDRLSDFPTTLSVSLPNVISVAATDINDKISFFSDWGRKTVQVAAPGQDIFSTIAEIRHFNDFDDDFDGQIDEPDEGTLYDFLDGTSMASPIVCGIVALAKLAKPDATIDELRRAVQESSEDLPTFNNNNDLPRKVTFGRVNAFRAIQFIQNQFVQKDTIRQGNWTGIYGSQGAYVVGESTAFPGFVTGQITGDSTQVDPPVSDTKQPALQSIADPTQRLVAYQATPSTMTIDLNFTDNAQHRVGIYMVDIDRKRRTQVVRLVDAETGIVTNSQTISSFTKGQYVFWDVQGHVQIQVERVSGPNAVFSGVFFDTPPTNDEVFFRTDTTTRGTWTHRYGSQGAYIVGESPAFPSFVVVTPQGKTDVLTDDTTRNASALQKPTNLARGIIAAWTSTSFFDFNLSFLDGKVHRTSFYFHDHNRKGRETRVEVYDETGTTLISRVDISDFRNGTYVTFDLQHNVKIRVTNLKGTDAGVHGIFFDAVPNEDVSFLGVDDATRGKWRRSRYGTVDSLIPGIRTIDEFNAQQIIATVNPVISELFTVIRDLHTSSSTAVQYPNNVRDGIVSYFEGATSLTLDINFVDNRTHRLAAYFADPDGGRYQRVEIIDALTGQTVSSTEVQDFRDGKHLVWDVRGHIQIKVTTYVPQTAILNGLFFD